MEREPLDSVEYESTYLELRPARERVTTAAAPNLTRRPTTTQVDVGAIASSLYAPTDIGPQAPDAPGSPAPPRNIARQAVRRWQPQADHTAGGPAGTPLRFTVGWRRGVGSGHLASQRRPRSWALLGPRLVVEGSACLGIIADVDPHAARRLFIGVTGVLILGWASLAWRGTSRSEPFGTAVTRVLDRAVTAVGTFFAIALWAKFAPHASAAFSRTVVLALCGTGLILGLLAARPSSSRNSLVRRP